VSDRASQAPQQWRPSSAALEPEQFEDAIAGSAVVIHFWAPWNPYDKPLDENLQKLMPAYGKKFRFYSVNTDDTAFSEIVEAQHIAALPTLLCFVNSRPRGRFHGLETIEALKDFLDQMSQPVPR